VTTKKLNSDSGGDRTEKNTLKGGKTEETLDLFREPKLQKGKRGGLNAREKKKEKNS